MTDNDWIKQLQSMMEHHEEPVGDDLWSDIEARLPEQEKPRRVMPAWRRYAAAAACALAVIGTGYLLWPNGKNAITEKPATVLNSGKSEPVTESLAQNDVTVPNVDDPQKAKAIAASSIASTNSPDNQSAQATTPAESEEDDSPTLLYCKIKADQETDGRDSSSQPNEHAQQPATERNAGYINPSSGHIAKPARQRRPITLDVYASNGLKPDPSNRGSKDFMAADPSLPSSHDSIDSGPLLSMKRGPSQESVSTKHHAPYSLGVSIRVPLTDRFSLTSGLVYTRVKSEFTSGYYGNYIHEEQTLHYLGVPLGATYSLWQYKRLNVYAIGGMQADFNFKATLKKNTQINAEKMQKDRVQFSALAGPGLQFDITQNFGIYVEPTLRYYFNNGSDIANYFKEKPWNVNLNGGLRLTLK